MGLQCFFAALVAVVLALAAPPAAGQATEERSLGHFLTTRLGFTDAQVAAVRRGRPIAVLLPALANYLLGYPTATRPDGTCDFFYWSLAEFGLKPVLRPNHVVVYSTGEPAGTRYAVAVKQLYASHYFHTALEIRTVVDDAADPGRQSYLVVLNMARSDGLTGVFGGIVKSKAQRRSREGLEKALTAIARLSEAPPR